jgi:uncharacterized cupin superfamily protein
MGSAGTSPALFAGSANSAPEPRVITMRKTNIRDVKEEPWQSPRGKYAVSFKGISEALGRDGASLDLTKRQPFDVELACIPPGKKNFPYHAHSAQWEMYVIVSGKGSVRDVDGTIEVTAGDAFIFRPNEPHQIENSGPEDLVYYVIADNPLGESGYYPDSGKWKMNRSSQADRAVIKGSETDYFDGEE